MIMELYKIKASDQSNLTQDRIATADGRFNRVRKVAPMCPPMWAYWRHRTTKSLYFTMSDPFPKTAPSHGDLDQLAIPWANPSPHPKRPLDRFSLFCTDDRRVSLCCTMRHLSPLKIAPFHEGICTLI